MLVLLLIVFFSELHAVQADGLFDFQMKLAEKGNAEAQFKVGEMYETGFGVKKDMAQAKLWVEKAAAQGNEAASYKLLYWDMQKNGMKGDNAKKYQAMLKKAEAGDGHAMYYAGMVEANGAGVKVNYDKALDWLNKATLVGILEAEREYTVVREKQQAAKLQEARDAEARKAREEAKRKAQQEEEKRKQAEARRKQQELQKKQAASSADEARKAEEARLLAERKARAAENERKRQALLKQKAENEQEQKDKFESDPCSGKSARFLSTCK